ncbi:sugar MFS transporter [Sinomicrobium soli]|uniref:sugar MFS transporter n=1 Tax=Sinomicrobium sp. N-1-3-6 TaxID=2219864 RepID=UPI000DCB9D15|nr:sugar MFS transporter [Sinomicrobium sp. N-1-3-6]RAV28436.1 MFS transporter [Sinomicrobium sp. N-1-3-6]
MNNQSSNSQPRYLVPLIAVTVLFFMWGFITCMNDILIPYLQQLFNLTYFQSMLVQFCFFGAYFLGSLAYFLVSRFRGDPINRIGYKKGIIAGIVLAASGCALFYPAATFSVYGLFLGALFVLGLGLTVLQITANAYVSLLGPEDSASSRLNMTQAFNSLGTTIAPVLGGHLIFEFFAGEGGNISPAATRIPYLAFAVVFVLIALMIYRVKLPSFTPDEEENAETDGLGALKFPQLRLGVIGIFCYVGGEVAIGSFMIGFMELDSIAGLSETVSKNYLSMYWGGAMIGRFLGAVSLNQSMSPSKKLASMVAIAVGVFALVYSIVDLSFSQMSFFIVFIILNLLAFFVGRSRPASTLAIFAAINVLLLLATIFFDGYTAMYAVLGIGIFNSIMFSNIYTLGIQGLGKYTSQGSSLLVMAILGGAIVPLIQGFVADTPVGLHRSFIVPVFCYLYILYYGVYCSRKKLPVQGAAH